MSLTSNVRESVSHYKLARKIVEQICQSNNLDVTTVWSSISSRDFDALDRHFRREKRRKDPLSSVKKPRTAFSFFTQANRNDIQIKNPTLSFGAVSKLVGEQWKALDDKSRAKYLALENEDKARYCTARQKVMDDMALNSVAASAPVATEPVAAESIPAPKKARVQKTAAPAAVAATPAATEAKSSKKAAKQTASAPVVAAPAATAATTEAKVAKKAATKQAAPQQQAAPAVAATPAPKKVAGGKKH